MKKLDNIKQYKSHYSDKKLFKKIFKYAKVAGLNIIYVGLLLFYTLENPKLPAKLKAIVVGSLGYFISPIDLIPDLLPLVGYQDDLGVLMAAVIMVSFYIDEDSKTKAQKKLEEIFGKYDKDILEEINKRIDKNKK